MKAASARSGHDNEEDLLSLRGKYECVADIGDKTIRFVISIDMDGFVSLSAGKGRLAELVRVTGSFHSPSLSELNFTLAGHQLLEKD